MSPVGRRLHRPAPRETSGHPALPRPAWIRRASHKTRRPTPSRCLPAAVHVSPSRLTSWYPRSPAPPHAEPLPHTVFHATAVAAFPGACTIAADCTTHAGHHLRSSAICHVTPPSVRVVRPHPRCTSHRARSPPRPPPTTRTPPLPIPAALSSTQTPPPQAPQMSGVPPRRHFDSCASVHVTPPSADRRESPRRSTDRSRRSGHPSPPAPRRRSRSPRQSSATAAPLSLALNTGEKRIRQRPKRHAPSRPRGIHLTSKPRRPVVPTCTVLPDASPPDQSPPPVLPSGHRAIALTRHLRRTYRRPSRIQRTRPRPRNSNADTLRPHTPTPPNSQQTARSTTPAPSFIRRPRHLSALPFTCAWPIPHRISATQLSGKQSNQR